MDTIWNEIIKEYKSARACLWCTTKCGFWYRKENEGYYHMWRAYHLASSCETKQPLWYARVLYMMASEQQHKQDDYVILNSYLRPCMAAYAESKQNGDNPTDMEYEKAKYLFDSFVHVASNTGSSEETTRCSYSYIEGFSPEMRFEFHDSKVISFSHDCSSAQLRLQYDGTRVTLLFEDICEIDICSPDPEHTWIYDFNCYPAFHNADILIFDTDFYKIKCRKIKLLQQ